MWTSPWGDTNSNIIMRLLHKNKIILVDTSKFDTKSFAFEDSADIELPIRMLGEIYVSIPRMKEQAREYQHSEKRELSFLVCHGLLHLLGYDHTRSEEEEKLQFGLQEEILNDLGITR